MSWYYGSKKASEEEMLKFVETAIFDAQNEYQIIVGTDSHTEGKNFKFVTILCVYKVGKGGDFYRKYTLEPKTSFKGGANTEVGKNKRHHNHKLRMFNEVAKSIELADLIKEKYNISPVVHIDASPPGSKHFTGAFSQELVGYVNASGYEGVTKPNSFAANCIADRYSK